MSSEQTTAQVRATIEHLLAEHAKALIGKDLQTALSLYSTEPVIRPNHAEPIRGRDALQQMFTAWFQGPPILSLEYTTEELWVAGDMAIQIGAAEAKVQLGAGEPLTDRRSFMGIWMRDGQGKWRAHRNIFNSSTPLPPPS